MFAVGARESLVDRNPERRVEVDNPDAVGARESLVDRNWNT